MTQQERSDSGHDGNAESGQTSSPTTDAPDERSCLLALRRFHFEGPAPGGVDGEIFLPDDVEALETITTANTETRPPVELFTECAGRLLESHWNRFRSELEGLSASLGAMLEVDRSKGPERNSADGLKGSMGATVNRFLNTEKMSNLIGPRRGSVQMAPERRDRLTKALDSINAGIRGALPPAMIPAGGADGSVDRCEAGLAAFRETSARFTSLFRSVRIARLETEGRYRPDHHDFWFSRFGPDAFTQEELALLPAIVVIDSADRLRADGIHSLSQLLTAGMPVHILAVADPAGNLDSDEENAGRSVELGYFGLSHRNAFVQQAIDSRPQEMIEGFTAAIESKLPALHLIAECKGGEVSRSLLQEAALAARAHPLFRYDPSGGSSWARRMDFAGNPMPASDWARPAGSSGSDGEATEGGFTFADYALLHSRFSVHFTPVPAGIHSSDLVELEKYLALDDDKRPRLIPFIKGKRDDEPIRLVVTHRLVSACRDRLDYWHTLQELAGVRSEYIREAVEKAVGEVREETRREREKLILDHENELERVRRETADEAMQSLARSLLDMDFLEPRKDAAPVPAEPESVEPEIAPPPAPEPEPAAEISEDPWIDTPLCTSCNDCTAINPLLFVYDENKQARIDDPTAGTFRELVLAAEKCPAKCIHPGQPINGDEPDLEDLKRRAEPFL